jgi:quercetin dioxygenase-like cupin family protein
MCLIIDFAALISFRISAPQKNTTKEVKMSAGKRQKNSKNLIGESLNLAGLIGYQKGAVVSRTLIDKKIGTVTLFSFDKGQGLSEHTVPYDAMVCILDGQVEITISGRPMTAGKGEMVIMPAHKPHALKALSKFKMLLIMIRA